MKSVSPVERRQCILGRIKEARALLPTAPAAPTVSRNGLDALPPAAITVDERIRAFAMRMEELGCSFVLCDSREQASDGMVSMFRRGGWKKVVAVRSAGIAELIPEGTEGVSWVSGEPTAAELAGMDAAVVEADAMECQFGAVLCGTRPGALKAVALAPQLLVAAPFSKLHPELSRAMTAIRAAHGGELPECLTWLTGACINQAIERRAVARGHGPQTLIVFLYSDLPA